MEAQNLFSVDDVLRNVTGIYTSFYDTERPLYFARGFQITDFQVDGIPSYSNGTNQEYDTALYQSVTVIRGANSLISGAGTPSAVVDLQRKRPGKTFDASIAGTVGSWDLYRAEIDVNTPLTPDGRYRARFVAFGETTESFLDRYSDETTGFLASFEADLTATTTLGVGYQFQKNKPDNPMWGSIPRFAADGSLAHMPRETNFATDWTYWNRESGTAFINLDQKLGENWNFRAAYNRTEGETDRLAVYSQTRDFLTATDYLPDAATGGGIRLRSGANQSEDVRDNLDLYLSGKFAAFDREHDLALGWNLNNYESDAAVLAGNTGAGAASWFYDIPNYYTYDGSGVPAPIVTDTGENRVTHTNQNGFFGTARLRVLDPVSVILGARLSNWETYVDDSVTGRGPTTQTTSELTPYAGIVYDVTQRVTLYASYTESFRPQTQKDVGDNVLAPAIGTNTELGLKADLIPNRLSANIAVFETKVDNYAVLVPGAPLLPDGSRPYMTVDGTESRGVEIEFNARLTDDWIASIGYSNINTRRNAADLTYANVPEHLVHLTTTYRLPGEWNRLSIGGGVNWQGEQTGVVTTAPGGVATDVRQAPFTVVNFFATYRFTDHFTGTLSVRNAFDKEYWATLDYPNYGEARSIQFTLRWSY
jgi:outer membrane receptor for ferric coprogen and ferric-rhodotorulic acid